MKENNYYFREGMILKLHRMLCILLLVLIFSIIPEVNIFATESYSQNKLLTLNLSNQTLKEVLHQIEDQSEFYFMYSEKVIDAERIVSVKADNERLSDVLNEVFAGTHIEYVIKDRFILLNKPELSKTQLSNTQQNIVTGKVVDANGQPMPGVSVTVRGKSQGVITDMDGKFSIQGLASNDVLEFSFVGMKTQEIVYKGQQSIEVNLEGETFGLDEVVVIGYGTQKKTNLTAAVEMVDTKMLENRPVRTVGQMLEGAVPNLNIQVKSGAPDATPQFNIRGFTGFNSNAQPLILVDGVEQNINLVNSNDIESISVLKDAAASAIYGSRAPHGVILITTKGGRKGQKMQINYSGDILISKPTYIWEMTNPLTWANTVNNKEYNSFNGPKFSEQTIQAIQDNLDGKGPVNLPNSNNKWGAHFDATNATQDRLALAYRDHTTNQVHNISVQGGTEKTSYYISTGFFENQGIYNSPVDKSERFNTMAKINTDLSDWLSIHTNMSYSRQEAVRPNYRDNASTAGTDQAILGGGALYYFPNVPSINPNGAYHWLSLIPTINGTTGQVNRDDYNLLISGGFDIKPFKDFVVKGNVAYIDNSVVSKKDTKGLLVEEADGTMAWSGRTARYDEVEEFMVKLLGLTIDLHASYTKDIGKHNILGMVGFQQDERMYHSLLGSNRDVYTTDVMSLSTTYGIDNKVVDDNIWHWATRGYFFRASYNYAGKYLFDFNSRYDAASKYSPESRWAYFPSVSVGYNMARENFWPIEQINLFKATATWGKLGDQAGGNYLYLPTMGTYAKTPYLLGGNQVPYVTQPSLVSADLTWAKPRTIGFGLEVGALRNRLQTEYRWYQRTIFDQLGPAEKYPEVLGTNPPQSNNAISETRGWELSLAWKDEAFNVMGSPIRYSIRGVLSDYIGYVVAYQDNTSGKRSGSWTPGQEFGILWGYRGQEVIRNEADLYSKFLWRGGWNYTGSTHIPDVNGDGRLTSGDGEFWYSMGDLQNLGPRYPRYKYSIAVSAGWKAFNLSVFLDGVGKQVYHSNSAIFIGNAAGGYISHALQMHEDLGFYSENNPDAFYPRAFYSGGSGIQVSDTYMLNLAHLRIKNINLSYSLPTAWVNKLKVSYMRVNISGENLGFVYNKLRLPMDPIQVANGGATYPIQQTFSFGVKVGL